MVQHRDKKEHFINARKAGILPPLLKWRMQNGFPVQHMAATEVLDGEYIDGTFEQGIFIAEKPIKNVSELKHVPPYTPHSEPVD